MALVLNLEKYKSVYNSCYEQFRASRLIDSQLKGFDILLDKVLLDEEQFLADDDCLQILTEIAGNIRANASQLATWMYEYIWNEYFDTRKGIMEDKAVQSTEELRQYYFDLSKLYLISLRLIFLIT